MFDEELRRRVERLARAEDGGLADAARAGIVERVVRDGPALIAAGRRERSRVQRTLRWGAGAALAAAAAVALAIGMKAPRSSLEGAGSEGVGSEGAGSEGAGSEGAGWRGSGASATRDVRACAQPGAWPPSPREAAPVFVASGGARRLDLGLVARVVAVGDARVHLQEAVACRTLLALDAGEVVIHAKALGGGKLTVRAGDTEVTVNGTLFAVERGAQGVEVSVSEGTVQVERAGRSHLVHAGHRLRLSSIGAAASLLPEDAAARLGQLVGEQKIVRLSELSEEPEGAPESRPAGQSSPSPSAGPREVTLLAPQVLAPAPPRGGTLGELVRQADAARRAGDHALARRLYGEAGQSAGPTAEAAWLALARMELELGRATSARRALVERRARFGGGTLGPEASWLEVRVFEAAGDTVGAHRVARELSRRWPESPQAAEARRFLRE